MPTPKTLAISLASLAVLLGACGNADTPADPPAVNTAEPPSAAPVTLTRIAAPADAELFFVAPENGATVTSPVQIEFGLNGMTVAKAGDDTPDSGHHHLIVNAALPDLNLPVPATENYIHFGDGATSTELTLPPGEHTLQLLLGDYRHVPHEPPVVSEPITITVSE